jgi:hypothetical protein
MGQTISSGTRAVKAAWIGTAPAKQVSVEALGGFHFYILNDDVMGGRSTSEVVRTSSDGILFTGNINTEGGGFASCRSDHDIKPLQIPPEASSMVLRVKGDGK